jgi:hypothetical protein
VSGDRPERGLDRWGRDPADFHELVGHRVAQPLCLVSVYCGGPGHSAPLLDKADGLGDASVLPRVVQWVVSGRGLLGQGSPGLVPHTSAAFSLARIDSWGKKLGW